MKLTPYWLDIAPPFSEAAREPVAGDYDVAVVGAYEKLQDILH